MELQSSSSMTAGYIVFSSKLYFVGGVPIMEIPSQVIESTDVSLIKYIRDMSNLILHLCLNDSFQVCHLRVQPNIGIMDFITIAQLIPREKNVGVISIMWPE
ncbi:unnamed protein product [Linum tenue]|uniref:Uncharacterized protein n=1 Tax=Linum tenue TaxID=586396 RepID=A0AAV0NW55_9ROSI|nr:unnamed protein product [Linum tenue]